MNMSNAKEIPKVLKEFATYIGLPLIVIALILLPIPLALFQLYVCIYLSILKAIKRRSAKADALSNKPATPYRKLIRPIVEIILAIPLGLAAATLAFALAIASFFIWPIALMIAIGYFVFSFIQKNGM